MRVKLIVLLVLIITTFVWAKDENENILEKYMKDNNVSGTVVIKSLKSGKTNIYNKERSENKYLPASTFKIVNTLIALQEKIVKDENEIIKWNGKDYGMAVWNKDQNMKTAFATSCVWFYQELSKKIGNDIYLKYLKNINYGNEKTGPIVESFWLEGDLRITAVEQIELLRKIYNKELKFDERNYIILKNIMKVDENEKYCVRAKTGVVGSVAWYVGYLETKDDVWFFACNIDYTKPEHLELRKQIVHSAFRELRIIE